MTLSELITLAYAEDLPLGDVTTDNLSVKTQMGDAQVIAKEDLVLAGREVFSSCIRHICPDAQVRWQFKDGDLVLAKQTMCWIKADLIQLLKAERVALNFLGHLCGIATLTRCFVQETRDTGCKILDTRKTTPLLRELEKSAVRAGGGVSHRRSLSEAVLIKENHIRAVGGIAPAVRSIRAAFHGKIEVECSDLKEVQEAVNLRVDRILLDNMDNEMTARARESIPATIEVEASGNMTLERIKSVAELGVDFISVGALTHSAPTADISMLFEWRR